MTVPQPTLDPPFNMTRASHIVLTSRDVAASRCFYVNVIGLVVSDEDAETVYLRGVEESCHHSLVLERSDAEAGCRRLGFRVYTDDDLEKAKRFFDLRGLSAEWVERPYQGRTLHVTDPFGIPLELCATMDRRPRLHIDYQLHRGAGALRFDHFQLLAPSVREAAEFYAELGFRISDYFYDDLHDGYLFGVFLHRKSNPHDLVFLTRLGPQMHHFGYIVPEAHDLFRACDIAGNIGFADNIERSPGRHGQGHALFVYFRDPDGHRVEILPPPIQVVDIDEEPIGWEQQSRFTWGLPPPHSWLFEASRFPGVEMHEPQVQQDLMTLEQFFTQRG
jgi:catechol 2,3-dioxygenase